MRLYFLVINEIRGISSDFRDFKFKKISGVACPQTPASKAHAFGTRLLALDAF